MNLTTQCPDCGTVFPISLAQLQLRKGYIRCINCSSIFDGYEAVVPDASGREPTLPASTASATPTPSAPPAVIPAAAPEPPSDGFRISSPGEHDSLAEPRFSLGRNPRSQPAELGEPVLHSPVHEPVLAVRRRAGAGDDTPDDGPALYIEPRQADEQVMPRFLREPSPARRRAAGVFWGILVLAGLLVASAQLVYVYRAQLAQLLPASRPVLQRFCEPLACSVPYARNIDHLVIMSSSLRSGSLALASGPGQQAQGGSDQEAAARQATGNTQGAAEKTTLNVVLRNTHDQASEWPTLVLSLTDFSGTLVARKNLSPQRYLSPAQQGAPFPPGSEAEISVPLELSNLKVNGYQLDKFFQ